MHDSACAHRYSPFQRCLICRHRAHWHSRHSVPWTPRHLRAFCLVWWLSLCKLSHHNLHASFLITSNMNPHAGVYTPVQLATFTLLLKKPRYHPTGYTDKTPLLALRVPIWAHMGCSTYWGAKQLCLLLESGRFVSWAEITDVNNWLRYGQHLEAFSGAPHHFF
jgi:hypothetical protein